MSKLIDQVSNVSKFAERPRILVSKFSEEDLVDFVDLSKLEFSKDNSVGFDESDWKNRHVELLLTSPTYIRWKHWLSPFGVSTFVRLATSTKTVGRILLQPRPLHTASQVFNVACATDTLVTREFRSPPSNFIGLIRASDKMSDFDFVYHTANEVTHKLFGKLLRFPNPFSLQSYGLPLRIAGLFSKLLGRRVDALDWLSAPFRWLVAFISSVSYCVAGLVISERPMNDTELNALFTKCLRQSGPLLARTNPYFQWRFGPEADFPATVYRVDRKGQLIGFFVVRQLELGGLNHLVLMDFLLDNEASLMARVSLRLWLIRAAILAKADTFFTMINPINKMAKKFIGFPLVHIPDSLLPHATPIFIRANGLQNKHFETDDSIHLTLADLDYF